MAVDVKTRYLDAVRELLDGSRGTGRRARAGRADLCRRDRPTNRSSGLVHVFGTGHSRIPVEELFPRYGSYPGFNPLVELSMTFHTQVVGPNGQRQAMFIERTRASPRRSSPGSTLGPPDAFLVFSASGRTAVPIEMAIGARERGLPVIVVTSVAESEALPPSHSSGTRLLDHADVLLDLCTPPGDALVRARRARHAGRARLDRRRRRPRERAEGARRRAPFRARTRFRRCSRARRWSAAPSPSGSSHPPMPSTRDDSLEPSPDRRSSIWNRRE